jgi:hypothetical protein
MNAANQMSRPGLLVLVIGLGLSIATTCADPSPAPFDTGRSDTGGGGSLGVTVRAYGDVSLVGAGATAVRTVRVTLPAGCLAEVPEYGWGYPTGWVFFESHLGDGAVDTGGGDTADTGASRRHSRFDTADTGGPGLVDTGAVDTGTASGVDTGAPDTGAVDTGWLDTAFVDTGWVDTGIVDTGAVDTGAIDTGAIDTGAIDTAAIDTAAIDTAAIDTGGVDTGAVDTGIETGTGETGDSAADDTSDTGPDPDARVKIVITRMDALSVADDTYAISTGTTTRGSATDLRPYTPCTRDAACEITWQVAYTLESGEAANGTLEGRARLSMCSSGEPSASDISVVVE